ncbi:MAG: septum formation protein Maf [Clostridiales bacterium]|nr:septum formation protein Maf [Clostridiales bacterium]
MDWILASASPRRKELFGEVVEKFEIIVAKGEEKACADTPFALVKSLAKQKAMEVARLKEAEGKAVLGADTVVSLNGEVLGKPKDEADARRMLLALSGKKHEVYTGVCMIYPDDNGERKVLVEADCTKVFFRELSKEFIEEYIRGGSPMDKAGAYGIQDGGLVEKIEGSFSNVVGLPVELCKEMIKKISSKGA